jgi:hypothetical protein
VIFPNPPINKDELNGHTLNVFLKCLPNSNLGYPSPSYKVAVAGYYPEITIK